MWTLTPDDIRRAKDDLIQRRSAAEAQHAEELRVLEARHAEELKAIDAELAEVTGMEQAVDSFARKYKPAAAPTAAEQPEFAKGLTTPVRLTVGSRNWGDARFTPVASASGD
jgi:hypothetical protein